MTIGTAIVSVTALGSFSVAAAATFPGSTGVEKTVAAESSSTTGQLTTDSTTSTSDSTATPTASLEPAATSAATTTRNAQVTSGGS